jgi:hypothetical protein
VYPSDLTRLSVVTRTDSSSSMIATSGSFDKGVFPWCRGRSQSVTAAVL